VIVWVQLGASMTCVTGICTDGIVPIGVTNFAIVVNIIAYKM